MTRGRSIERRSTKPIRGRDMKQLPSWCVKGARVNYSRVIGETPSILGAIVTQVPWPADSTNGATYWVTMIDKKNCWVAVEALSQAGPHDRDDCPCGHPPGDVGPNQECAGCNCADQVP